jgi:hypothetical protein
MQTIVCLQLLKIKKCSNRNIKRLCWANLVETLKYPYSQALNPATTSNPDGYFLPI